MMNFDERDLITHADNAGFGSIHLELALAIVPLREARFDHDLTWESFTRFAFNPKLPTLEEACAEVLTPAEAAEFTAHMRPLVEAGAGTARSALAHLWARK